MAYSDTLDLLEIQQECSANGDEDIPAFPMKIEGDLISKGEESDNPAIFIKKSKFNWKSPQLLTSTKRFSTSNLLSRPPVSSSLVTTPNSPNFESTNSYNRQNSQSNETSNSSVSIEENKGGSLSRSFYSLKRTTKSILFLDSSPSVSISGQLPSSSSGTSPDLVDNFQERMNEEDSDLKCRRSISYNNGGQIASNADLERPSVSTPITIVESPPTKNEESNKSPVLINRQRSRTLNSLENPLTDLAGSNTGIFASITNFVKLNRPPQRKLSVTSTVTSILNAKDALSMMDGVSPSSFLDTILESYPLTQIISILSLKDNQFSKDTMQIYFKRYFDFTSMPLDIALRYFLMINDLPKETQQIDRVVYQFAKYYITQIINLGFDEDSIYILTFSLIMLNTDRFNPNNKNKMTRFDFIRNVDDALKLNCNTIEKDFIGYYFDNITHAPLIKISPEQGPICLRALENNEPLPYPIVSFLNPDQYQQQQQQPQSQQQQQPLSPQLSLQQPQVTTTPSEMSISRSPSMQQLSTLSLSTPQLRRRRSSASFLWNSTLPLDPYQYIIERNVQSLTVPMINFSYANPFLNTKTLKQPEVNMDWSEDIIQKELNNYIDEGFTIAEFTKIFNSMTKGKVDLLLKVPKSKGSFLKLNKFAHSIPLNEPEDGTVKNEYFVVRVLKVGMLNRQESKTLTNTKTWKKYFCILTSLGLFMFKSVSLFKMVYVGTLHNNKAVVIEESESTGLLDQFQPTYSINRGSFASRKLKNLELDKIVNSNPLFNNSNSTSGANNSSINLQNYTFFIYGPNTNTAFMVSNIYELRSWILNINIVNALNGVKLPHEKLEVNTFKVTNETELVDKYYEIAPVGDETISERILNTCEMIDFDPSTFQPTDGCNLTLWHQIQYMKTLEILTPLQQKTRDTLQSTAKMMSIKVEWMWFEKCRSRMVLEFLLKVQKVMEDNQPLSSLFSSSFPSSSSSSSSIKTTGAIADLSIAMGSEEALQSPKEIDEKDEDYYSCLELSL